MTAKPTNDRRAGLGRRAFLRRGALLGSVALLGPASCGDPRAPRSLGLRIERWRARRLLRRLRHLPLTESIPAFFSYLDLDPAGVERFEREWLARRRAPSTVRELEGALSQFLASTDFFLNGADETRRIRFVQLQDPATTPCFDPVRM